MTYETIVFDLDGTLTDPAVGITGGVRYALGKFGIAEEDWEKLCAFIGPPLKESFQKFYGFTPKEIEEATGFYREYYGRQGKFENRVYDGIPQMLSRLHSAGKRLCLATYKGEGTAREILDYFGLTSCFCKIAGQRMGSEELQKSQMIEGILEELETSHKERAVMVGDRRHDADAARESGIHSIGVLYGYGSKEELSGAGAEILAANVKELERLLLG